MRLKHIFVLLAVSLVLPLVAACGGGATPQTVVETVVVEKEVQVVETVEVEKEVIQEVEKVVTVEVPAEAEAESTLARIQSEGVVRVGFANENPYAFAQPDGTLSGEAVEVARAVFENMGIEEMEGVLTEFGSLIPGLQAGRFDVITAGMYVNPGRCEQVYFADPEYKIGEALVVPAGNPLDLHSYEDIAANPEVTIGTGAGYLENDMLLTAGVAEDQIVTFPDDPSGMAGLQAGQIDAWTGTRPTLIKLLQVTDDPGFELADPFDQPIVDGKEALNFGAAAFRLDDVDFRNAFNDGLQQLKDDGSLVEIISQFEGFDAGADPGDVTVTDICPDAYTDVMGAATEDEAMAEATAEPTDEAMEEATAEPTEEAMAEDSGEMAEIEPVPGGAYEAALAAGSVTVGFANENPYAYSEPDGTLTGEAVEVARAVLQGMGIEEMEGVLTEFGSLIPGLQAGRFDIITAGMYVNPDRCEQVLFADPEYKIGEALVVPAGNPLDLHSYEDIAANPELTIGTGAGYLENDMLLTVGVAEDQIVTFPDDPSGMAGLQAGQIDAWTGTRPTLVKLLQVTDDPNFELADPFDQPVIDGEEAINFGAAAFRYDDEDFRQAFNQGLQKLKDDGTLVEIISQFEGFDAGADPGDVTAETLCPDAYSDIK
ncbi:MAG TPA: ectoine/hydroxyectoine ABC transporter substrate-binding protein EhuB [Anaerolineae bacterium]|nr:ectoine/hydroxyectoine ABC transporter substrate-binding protein EhuB [Anaerolineae bacterium]HRV92041.1 ectoine/hydroxyectoine ABC transporter substrate-binding protein EhuB [Anaerolineae bacterium]